MSLLTQFVKAVNDNLPKFKVKTINLRHRQLGSKFFVDWFIDDNKGTYEADIDRCTVEFTSQEELNKLVNYYVDEIVYDVSEFMA